MKKFTMPQIFPSLPNHLWNQPRGLGVLALLSSVFMFACGDAGTTENITNNYTSGMEIAEKVSDLPKCSADNAGEQYLVKADGEFYACNGKDWKALGGSGFAADYSCETKPLADDSGVAIYCGGDSIGVVLNGKDGLDGAKGERGKQGDKGETGEAGAAGADGKDGLDGKDGVDGKPGVGCKVTAQTESAVTIQCGDDKFNMNLNSGSGEVIEPVEEVVSLEKLNGVSQKGPFINGSTVTLFELDGSRSLVQTGRTFGGEIITDDGRFSVNNVSLKSSYVRLTANGFYRNEVSGKNSTSSIVLNAYSDLQARNSVNINLLTHLEYYRVGYLMENGLESTIKASKKRAQKEIFAAFGIDNAGFGYSEDLDVFGEGDQNAALLAMSILLQGSRSEADLSALLANFGKDIEEDGTWDDKATRAKIADWADSVDLGLKGGLTLPKIKDNVSKWGLGSVSAFEKYIRNFWYKEYGLGDCDESNKNELKRNTNNKSIDYNKTYYVCLDGRWVKASEARYNTVHYECNKNGELLKGLVNTDKNYTCDADTFRVETDVVAIDYFKKACVSYLESPTKVVSQNGTNWTCKNSKWVWDENAIAGTMTDVRDRREYKTTVIGFQTWMAENLDYDYNEGTAISFLSYSSATRSYLWSAAMDSAGVFSATGKGCGNGVACAAASKISTTLVRGACPEGWHLPNSSDWNNLWTIVGGKSTAGSKLKSTSGWSSWDGSNGGGEDAYGFSVFPKGDGCGNSSNAGYFWSSTESDSSAAYRVEFDRVTKGATVVTHSKSKCGVPIRCLKD